MNRDLSRIDALVEREAALREAARKVELNPSRCEEARSLFERASLLRRRRMALLQAWQLI